MTQQGGDGGGRVAGGAAAYLLPLDSVPILPGTLDADRLVFR